jgi:hypothetical protein
MTSAPGAPLFACRMLCCGWRSMSSRPRDGSAGRILKDPGPQVPPRALPAYRFWAAFEAEASEACKKPHDCGRGRRVAVAPPRACRCGCFSARACPPIPSFDDRFRVDSLKTFDMAEDYVQAKGPVARLLRYWFESNGIQLRPQSGIPLSQGRSGHANRSQGRTREEADDRGVAAR